MAPLVVSYAVGVFAVALIGLRIRGFWPSKVDRFPRLPVAHRAWSDGVKAAASFYGAVTLAVVAGVLGAFNLDPGASTLTKIINGVGSGAIALAVVYGLAAGRSYLVYRRSGYAHDRWQSTLGEPRGGMVRVFLQWPPSNIGQERTALGAVRCLHERPTGDLEHLTPIQMHDEGPRQSISTQFGVEDGDHEIRWYTDPRNVGTYAELCRHTFTMQNGQIS